MRATSTSLACYVGASIAFHIISLYHITLIIYSAAKSRYGCIGSETLYMTIPINRSQRILYSHLEHLSEHVCHLLRLL